MLWYQQRLIHVAPLYHVVPTLAEIVFNIGDSQPFQDGMRVMPGMWDEIMHPPAQFIGEVMFWHIPAVKVAVQLNKQINTTDKGVRPIDDGNFLV